MRIEVICQPKLRSAALRSWILERFRLSSGEFATLIKRIRVKVFDTNGMRKGPDKACQVFVELKGAQPICMTSSGSDLYGTSAALAGELKYKLNRTIDRLRNKRRAARREPLMALESSY